MGKNPFYFSKNGKFIAGYWNAPRGWFEAKMGEQSELNYIIKEEIKLISGGQ